jgi:ferredoxin
MSNQSHGDLTQVKARRFTWSYHPMVTPNQESVMALRTIIQIDEDLCDGCGLCVPACHEGALQIVDGKARLVNERYCDGLGDCLGECPQGAITLVKADSAPFDEHAVAQHQANSAPRPSELRQWPVQLHLLSPTAPYLAGADLLLCADCVAYTDGDYHRNWLRGRALAIACPKLDGNQQRYLDKLTAMVDQAQLTSITVLMMQVPCCRGILMLAQQAVANARRSVPIKAVVIGLRGEVLGES